MYLPKQFAEPRLEKLHRIVREYSLGMLVTHTSAGLEVNHLPFLLDAGDGSWGTLQAHVARANPIWRGNGRRLGTGGLSRRASYTHRTGIQVSMRPPAACPPGTMRSFMPTAPSVSATTKSLFGVSSLV